MGTAIQLPLPPIAPVESSAWDGLRLKPSERQALERLLAGEPLTFLIRTGTKVDVGEWFRRARLWLGCGVRTLVLFAAGKRPLAVRLPIADAREAHYNAFTGELILPAPALAVRRIALPPLEGYRFLAHIRFAVEDKARAAGASGGRPTDGL